MPYRVPSTAVQRLLCTPITDFGAMTTQNLFATKLVRIPTSEPQVVTTGMRQAALVD
jgi:hypothetical protein